MATLKNANFGRKGFEQKGDNGAPGKKKPSGRRKIAATPARLKAERKNLDRTALPVPTSFKPGHEAKGAAAIMKEGRTPENAEKWDEINDKRKRALEEAKNIKHVRSETLEEIKNVLFSPTERGVPFYSEFVKKFCDHGMEDPDSAAGRILSQILLPQETIKMMDDSHEKMIAKNLALLRSRVLLERGYFLEQQLVLMDTTSTNIIVCGGRRSGKTEMIAGLFVLQAVTPKTPMIYFHKTFENGIKQMYDHVFNLAEEIDLPILRASKADGFIEFKNKSTLQFKGLSTKSEADMVRGFKYKIAVVDEAAFQANIRYLLDETLGPAMSDFGSSRKLILVSTPPVVPKSRFEKIYNEPGWRKFSWNFFANPYIPEKEAYIEDLAAKKGTTVDDPYIRREYFGEWVYDTEAEVFKDRSYIPDDKPITIKPTNIIFGVDYGFTDYNSIVGLAYNKDERKGWVFHEEKFNKSDVSRIAAACMKANKKATDLAVANDINLETIYFYADSSHQAISYEMSTQYGLRFTNAYKYNKAFAISQLSSDLKLGNILIKKDGIIDDEMSQVIYLRDETTNAILPIIDENNGIHPEISMSLLYAYRQFCFDCNIELSEEDD